MNSNLENEKRKLMAEASQFRDSAERRSFWTLIVIVIISTLAIAIFNFVL
ncbi:TPA: hypothetical protein L9N02_004019 [Klebsiella quasipneumoniae subsp. similipneumoniae]|nr:hypothetical protein [Klebsiella pneumoniae]MCF1372986.1 hypothetical protein [Klebsiella pneumoniae]HBR2117529.1 hypothetical protein [Klebsiella quasipneumoniae subsp. similipneumoniae]